MESRNSIFVRIKNLWSPSRISAPVIIVLIALISFGVFYYLDFSKREANFTKRAFRHLTLISDTIALQTDNYYKAILNAPPNIDEQYLATFLPGVLYSYDNSKNYRENSIISEDDNYYLFLKLTSASGKPIYLKAPILSLLKNRRSTSISSDLFNDVLLADSNGSVIFQSNQSGPRIIQVDTLIQYAAAPDAKERPGGDTSNQSKLSGLFVGASTFSNVIDVQIAGAKHKLFLQPLYLKIGNTETGPDRPHYVLCGLIRSDQFFIESLRVPYVVILCSTFCTLLLALSLPFFKIVFMKSRERFLRGDALRLVFFTPITIFLACLALVASFYFIGADDTDAQLQNLSGSISVNFAKELSAISTQMETLSKSERVKNYPKDIESFQRLPDALKSIITSYDSLGTYPFFNSVFWLDQTGHHRILWTVREEAPPLLDVGNRAYAKNLQDKKYSYIKQTAAAAADRPITLEPINSWITGENSLVSCIPHPIGGTGMVTKPLSLIGPFVPRGFGYAVINVDGLVLFHSDESKNLVENAYEESDMNQSLIWAARNRVETYADVIYRGKDYRFYITPFRQIDNLPWILIVFRERTPLRLLYSEVLLECLICFLILHLLVSVVVYAFVRRPSWISGTDFPLRYFPNWLWPDKEQATSYALHSGLFSLLIAISLLIVFWGSRNFLFGYAFIIPLLVITFYLGTLKRGWKLSRLPNSHLKAWKTLYLISLLLLLVLIVVVPTLAFFKVCANYEESIRSKRDQLSLAAFYQGRAERLTDSYKRINFPSEEKRTEFLNARLKTGREALDSYESVNSEVRAEPLPKDFQCAELPSTPSVPFVESALSLIRPSLDRLTPIGGVPKYDAPSDLDWHLCEKKGMMPQVVLDHYRSDQGLVVLSNDPATPLPWRASWWLGFALLLLLMYKLIKFATSKLFLGSFEAFLPNFTQTLPNLEPNAQNSLIVCNPRSRDQLRANYVHRLSLTILDARELCNGGGQGCGLPIENQSKLVVLDHFEYRMDDERYSQAKFELLKSLIQQERTVLVITTLDPLYYLISQSSDTTGTEGNDENRRLLERFADLLKGFSKYNYADSNTLKPLEENSAVAKTNSLDAARTASEILDQECIGFRPLQQIKQDIAAQLNLDGMPSSQVIDEVSDRASAFYYTLWSELAVIEKLLLIHLSQEGFVNPKNTRLVQGLIRKGLIVRQPDLRVFNESFRRFVASVESPEQIGAWEQKNYRGGWGSIRIIFWAGLLSLVVFLLYTQREWLQSGITILTAMIGAIAALLKVLDDFKRSANNQPEKS